MVFYYLWEPLKATFEFRRTTTISDSSKCSRRWKLNRFCTARFYNNCIIAPTTSWCYKLLICRTFKLNWIWQSQNVKLHSQKISFLIEKYHYLVSKTSASFTIDEKWEYRKDILLYTHVYILGLWKFWERIYPPPLWLYASSLWCYFFGYVLLFFMSKETAWGHSSKRIKQGVESLGKALEQNLLTKMEHL